MSVYDYEKFLDKYDSDKAIKKFVDLRRKEKEKEIFRKIGLDEYFQPVTSVIRQELKPFHKLIKNPSTGNLIDLDNKEGVLVDPERYEEEDTWGSRSEDERDIEEGGVEAEEDKWGSRSEDKDDDDDDYYFSPEEKLPGYGESLGFSNFHALYSAYPDEKRNTDEFLDAYKATLKKKYNYEENRDNFSGLSLEDLKEKENELKKINHSINNMYKYNKKINEIIEDAQNQKEKINERKNLIIRMEHGKENKTTTTRKKNTQNKIEEQKKYEKDVKENRKINEMFKKKEGKGIGRGRIGKGIGRGVKKGNNNGSLIYYNNPQQLIDRLRLLVGSKKAGNTNPEIDSEIIGISDELVKKGLINNEEYTRFMNKNFINY